MLDRHPSPPPQAYDRWEQRRSVAARGDRLSDEDSTATSPPAVAAFESYSYDRTTSQLRFEAETDAISRIDYDKLAEVLLRCFVPLLLGFSVGALGWLSNSLTVAIINVKWSMVLSLLNSSSLSLFGIAAAYPVLAIYCMLLSAGAAAMTIYVAPAAAGSGIQMIKAELNGVRVPGALTARTLAVKLIGVTLVVASGLPCGREGPMVQLGAGMACLVLRAHNKLLSHPLF